MITAQERAERLRELQTDARVVFDMLRDNKMPVDRGRLALEFLQLMTDLVDLSDSVARRAQTK